MNRRTVLTLISLATSVSEVVIYSLSDPMTQMPPTAWVLVTLPLVAFVFAFIAFRTNKPKKGEVNKSLLNPASISGVIAVALFLFISVPVLLAPVFQYLFLFLKFAGAGIQGT